MGEYYIVRSDKAGVFFGRIEERRGDEVTMTDVRKLWYWDGACAIEQLAKDGTKKPWNCKFTVTVDSMVILDVIQVIPCTKMVEKSLREVQEWGV